MKNLKVLITSLAIILIFQLSNAYGLDKTTHFLLNGYAVDKSGLNGSLKNIGLSGIGEKINGFEVKYLIQEGGRNEDEPIYTRSFNHFLNPITNAGYSGTFKSALQWAQDQGGFGSLFGGNYSWKAVREYYFIALTGSDFGGVVVAPDQNYWRVQRPPDKIQGSGFKPEPA